MKKAEIKQKVLEYIEKNQTVSYAELEWLFELNQYDYKGNLDAISEQCDHVVIWSGWNQEAYTIMAELLREGKIHREPVDPFVYLVDGSALSLPVVKKKIDYKEDHWLPTVFCKGCG